MTSQVDRLRKQALFVAVSGDAAIWRL